MAEKKTSRYSPEFRELRQANEILKKASAYFAQAALAPFSLPSNDALHRRNLLAAFACCANDRVY